MVIIFISPNNPKTYNSPKKINHSKEIDSCNNQDGTSQCKKRKARIKVSANFFSLTLECT